MKSRCLITFFCLFVMLTFSNSVPAKGNNLHIYFLDVGQGDAMILHQPLKCSLLIDTGPPVNGYRVTRKLQELGISSLDMVVITHPHLDHYGGIFDVYPRFKILQLYDNGTIDTSPYYHDNYRILKDRVPYDVLTAGTDLTCGDIAISVLHPLQSGHVDSDFNAESLVMMISFARFRLLQMGDLAGSAERAFVMRADDLEADVIKIAHHGAPDSTSKELLEAVKPRYAVISTAEENSIGAPAKTVLNRISEKEITYFRTDRDKTIELQISPHGYNFVTPAHLPQDF